MKRLSVEKRQWMGSCLSDSLAAANRNDSRDDREPSIYGNHAMQPYFRIKRRQMLATLTKSKTPTGGTASMSSRGANLSPSSCGGGR